MFRRAFMLSVRRSTAGTVRRLPARVGHFQLQPLLRSPVRFQSNNTATLKVDDPQLMIAFTCKKCDTRSSHTFSKQAYTHGTVLIQCPGCKGRHLIADNLKFFEDKNINLEDLLAAQGESVAKDASDLAFKDIPESLRKTIGHHAKDAPEEYQLREGGEEGDSERVSLPEGSRSPRSELLGCSKEDSNDPSRSN